MFLQIYHHTEAYAEDGSQERISYIVEQDNYTIEVPQKGGDITYSSMFNTNPQESISYNVERNFDPEFNDSTTTSQVCLTKNNFAYISDFEKIPFDMEGQDRSV
jgi:hypothetical protein